MADVDGIHANGIQAKLLKERQMLEKELDRTNRRLERALRHKKKQVQQQLVEVDRLAEKSMASHVASRAPALSTFRGEPALASVRVPPKRLNNAGYRHARDSRGTVQTPRWRRSTRGRKHFLRSGEDTCFLLAAFCFAVVPLTVFSPVPRYHRTSSLRCNSPIHRLFGCCAGACLPLPDQMCRPLYAAELNTTSVPPCNKDLETGKNA